MVADRSTERIGKLFRSQHIYCDDCAPMLLWNDMATLTRENIGSYSQSCHNCGRQLVSPLTAAWPELFSEESCEVCSDQLTSS